MDRNTIVRDFNNLLISIDRSSRQKINKATEILNDTLKHLDLIDIFRTLYIKKKPNIHSGEHGTFSVVDHILGHKRSLNKFKNTENFEAAFLTTTAWNWN